MKLVVAIVQDNDSNALMNRLIEENIRVTKLASTGGFLKKGNTTFLAGVEEKMVDTVLSCIKETCRSREQVKPQAPALPGTSAFPIPIKIGGATVFVLDVFQFEQF